MNETLALMKRSYKERTEDPYSALRRVAVPLGLSVEVLWLALQKNQSKDLPYHGNFHNMDVAFDALILAQQENIAFRDRPYLFIAGLFHDYNHSGGTLTDTENVINAVKAFRKYSTLLLKSSSEADYVAELIYATNTDNKRMVGTFEEGLLKDADLTGWTYLPFKEHASALSAELGIKVNEHTTKAFIQGSLFYTPTARKLIKSSHWS